MHIIEEIQKLLPPDQIQVRGETEDAGFTDWGVDRTKDNQPRHQAVVWPKTTEETAAVVRLCSSAKTGIVPSGGRTGYAGGAVAHLEDSIVLSTAKMTDLVAFDATLPSITVQAGATLAQVQQWASDKDHYYPVDMASKGSAAIGGTVATNAGGIHVIKYSNTRRWVKSLTMVDGTGTVHRFGRSLSKDNTGYDLKELVIGSEGTLGIITEVELALTTPPGDTCVCVVPVARYEDLFPLLQTTRAEFDLLAFECFDKRCLEIVCEHTGAPNRIRHNKAEYYALFEFILPKTPSNEEQAMAELAELQDRLGLLDLQPALIDTAKEKLWLYRESISESLSIGFGAVHKNDISLPPNAQAGFLTKLHGFVKGITQPVELVVFGHAGDGNLHLNFLSSGEPAELKDTWQAIDVYSYGLLKELGGSVSAEHGIGLLKRDYLHYSRSQAEIELMKSIKASFDPFSVLNARKLLP